MRMEDREGKNRNRHSWLFLLEITLALLILTFGLGMIVRVNLKADSLTREAAALRAADRTIENADALIRSSESEEDLTAAFQKAYPECKIQKISAGQSGDKSGDRSGRIRWTEKNSESKQTFFTKISYRIDGDGLLTAHVTVSSEKGEKKTDSQEIRHYLMEEKSR